MEEKLLIKKFQKLRKIEPSKEWVAFTRERILGKEEKSNLLLPLLSFGGLFLFLFLPFSLLARKALPGEVLYPLKRGEERVYSLFVPKQERPEYELKLANKRLEELKTVAQKNEVRKLSPAIISFQKGISRAAKSLKKTKKVDKKVASEVEKLARGKKEVEKVLGTKIGNEEYQGYNLALKGIVEREIKRLEASTLTKKEKTILGKAKMDFQKGNYSQALGEILSLNKK